MPPESPLPRPSRRPVVAPSLEERAAAVAGTSIDRRPSSARTAPVRLVQPRTPAAEATAARTSRPPTGASRSPQQPGESPSKGPVILGIDPGTRIVGWGAIELTPRGPRLLAAGALKAGEGELAGRLGTIRRGLDRLIELYRPCALAVEDAFAHKNVQSALRIGEGRGVVLSCAAAGGVPVHQYSPASAKKTLVGNGAAHKVQVAAMVARRLELSEAPKPLDASDALALALTHFYRAFSGQALPAATRTRRVIRVRAKR